MTLIAQKPCSFGGKKFYVGDEIPEDLVISPRAQAKMGVLTIYNTGGIIDRKIEAVPEVGEVIMPLRSFKITIPIETENGIQDLSVAPESIIDAHRIMQMDVKDAEKAIENLDDENALIILHACDSRKGIKNASEKKALAMQHQATEEPMDEEEKKEEQLDLTDMEESEGDD